jgi:serine/threonine-protein kinase HipA
MASDARGKVFFEYDADWRTREIELSPVHLPISLLRPATVADTTFGPLFGLFDDSMPDWWGQKVMRHHFSSMNIPWNEVTPLEKLACQGSFGIGALAYEPDLSPGSFRDVLATDVAELVASARSLLDDDSSKLLPALVRGGLSPGGAQPKAMVAFDDSFQRAVAGGATPPDGFTRWLVKFQLDCDDPVGAEEHAFTGMAREAGIRVPETRLFPTADGLNHFLTRRFDRPSGSLPLHLHSYAGLTHTPPREIIDYSDILALTRQLTLRETEVEEMFARAVFNIAIANDDDHSRNHAYLWSPEDGWLLSPAYDLTHTSFPLGSGFRAAGILGRFAKLGLTDLHKLAAEHSIRQPDKIIERVIESIRRWPSFAEQAGLSENHAALLADEMPASRW